MDELTLKVRFRRLLSYTAVGAAGETKRNETRCSAVHPIVWGLGVVVHSRVGQTRMCRPSSLSPARGSKYAVCLALRADAVHGGVLELR